MLGLNASSYRVRRYFQDEQALTFTVDPAGAPGMQWPEPRLGAVRPRLDWQIEVIMMDKASLKRLLGELPLAAELYWQLRQHGKPLQAASPCAT